MRPRISSAAPARVVAQTKSPWLKSCTARRSCLSAMSRFSKPRAVDCVDWFIESSEGNCAESFGIQEAESLGRASLRWKSISMQEAVRQHDLQGGGVAG